MTAQAAPEAEDLRPAVTQVVEVVEEEVVEPTPPEEPPVQEPPAEESSTTTKSMVEELYTPEKNSRVMPEISMHKSGPKKSLVVWAVVTIIVALLTGGILFAASRKPSMPSLFIRPTPTPTPAPTPTPTPTPAAIDKTSFEIKVLNGGGTPGAAGKMKTFLEEKGYKVSGTGNTEAYTFTSTEIHGKPTMTDAIANLKADLKDSYTLGSVSADLSASASADIQVIVGKE